MFLKEVALELGKLLCEVLVLILIYIFHILFLLHLCVIIWYIYYEILQYLFIIWNFMKLLHDTLIKWTGITTKYLFADVQLFKLYFFCRKMKTIWKG